MDSLGPDELLIRVRAAACNFPDMLQCCGQHQLKPELPFVPGHECAGEVVATGSSAAAAFGIGDRVMCMPVVRGSINLGGMQSWLVADKAWTFPIPGGLSFEEAAGVPVAYLTAYTALIFRGGLLPKQTVLVLGATGGVGLAAVQMAKAVGATVIAAGGSDEKLRIVREECGADQVVNYSSTPRFREAVKEMTGGRGVDVVCDMVSGSVMMEALRCCSHGAKVLVVGYAGAPVSEGVTSVPTPQILAKNLAIVGCGYDFTRRSNVAAGMKAIAAWIEEGKIRPRVHASLALEEVNASLMMIWNREALGKVVLVPP